MEADLNVFNKAGKYKFIDKIYKIGAVSVYKMENIQNKEMYAVKVIVYKDES